MQENFSTLGIADIPKGGVMPFNSCTADRGRQWTPGQLVGLSLFVLATCAILAADLPVLGIQAQPQQEFNQHRFYHARRERASWCTTSWLERKKCLDWARAIEETNIQFEGSEPFKLNLDCVQGADKDQCMSMIDDERADMVLLDPGEIGVASRYHSLTPVMLERYGGSMSGASPSAGSSRLADQQQYQQQHQLGHYSVAVVKKRSAASIQSLSDLYGRRACFSGVSHMASWTLPLASLIDLPSFEIADCNNLVKSASYFFGNSCAPNALISKFNPTGDNPQKMSQLCERAHAGAGSGRALVQGGTFEGAFSALKCLAEPTQASIAYQAAAPSQFYPSQLYDNSGRPSLQQQQQQHQMAQSADVAFLPHNTLQLAERLSLTREARLGVPARAELELLCPQGGRAPLDRWISCNFGFVPAHAVIVSSRTPRERREAIQRFLKTSVQLFGVGGSASSPLQTTQTSSVTYQTQQQQQQQQVAVDSRLSQSPFDFGLPPIGSGGALAYGKLNTNFKLNGDVALANYPSLDVLFSSDMVDLVPLTGVGQTFKGFLNSFPVQPATSAALVTTGSGSQPAFGYAPPVQPARPGYQTNSVFEVRQQTDYFEKLRRCSLPAAVVCVTSEREFNKCLAMSRAFHAAGLKPELNCKLAQSSLACMQLIKQRDADLTVLDAADVYLAGQKFGLVPILAEQIEMADPSHYAVAVAKKADLSTDLFNLKGKMSCHAGFLKGAGWVMPMNFLLSNERVRRYEACNSARSAAEHFDKSCAPGILSSVSNTHNVSTTSWTIRNMCELCHGTGRGYCARDASEPFFGDTGAFRCLIEGGGQVAFCKHTAIFENTGGSNRETWARNLIKSDFELLCRDGSRAPVNAYKTCNLGRVPPNAMVTRGDTPFQLIDTYVNLFMYGQQYYGSKYSEEYTFKMFASTNGRDLIFQDATQQLVRVPLVNQTYRSYLDNEFLRAIETVLCL